MTPHLKPMYMSCRGLRKKYLREFKLVPETYLIYKCARYKSAACVVYFVSISSLEVNKYSKLQTIIKIFLILYHQYSMRFEGLNYK